MIAANYFDGLSGRLLRVELSVNSERIEVLGEGISRRFEMQSTSLAEPFATAPCVLNFADGSRCEVHHPDAKKAVLAGLNYRKSLVTRWQDKWPGALLAIVIMALGLVAGKVWGIPLLASHLVPHIPLDLEKQLGDEALNSLDSGLLKPSTLSNERLVQVQTIFQKIVPPHPRMPLKVVLRSSGALGPNAIALPNGTIVVTDAMVELIAADSWNTQASTGEQADRLASVLAHEIGHIEGRHSLKHVVKTSLIGAISWTLIGDFSAVAAGAPAVLIQLEYSRELEAEADDYAVRLLSQHAISPGNLADVFEMIEAKPTQQRKTKLPDWMRDATDYLSTHPANEERIARLRKN